MNPREPLIGRYIATWNTTDEQERLALIRLVRTEGGEHLDPMLNADGPEAIATMIGAVQARYPGHALRREGDISPHHDRALFG